MDVPWDVRQQSASRRDACLSANWAASPPPSPPPMTRAHAGCSLVASLALLCTAHAQTCRSWRQTGGCDPLGPREPAADLDCSVMVPRDASGYCECAGGRKASLVTCDHEPIVCRIECDRDTSPSAGQSPSSDGCIAWRQTAGCDPQGERESDRDSACTQVVSRGASGFCECEGGRRVNFVTCDHAPFTCAVACQADRDRARSRWSAPSWRCHSRSGLLGLKPRDLRRALRTRGWPLGRLSARGLSCAVRAALTRGLLPPLPYGSHSRGGGNPRVNVAPSPHAHSRRPEPEALTDKHARNLRRGRGLVRRAGRRRRRGGH